MAFKPNEITKEHVLKGIEEIKNSNELLTNGTRWEVLINGESYPPKEVMRFAREQYDGSREWPKGGGWPTNDFLEKMGFQVKEIEKKIENQLKFAPYFNLPGIWDYQKLSGTNYDSLTKEADWYYDTREKLYFLISLISEQLNEEFEVVYTEKPNAQKGRGKILFKDYVLAGFAPKTNNIGDHLFIKLSFTNIKLKPFFALDLDMNFREGKSKFIKERDKIYLNSLVEWEINNSFPDNWNDLLELIVPEVRKLNVEFKNKIQKKSKSISMPIQSLNKILFGPPGTGKTYITKEQAVKIANSSFVLDPSWTETTKREEIINEYDRLYSLGQIVFTTFHQSMSYEDFIEGIKPKTYEGKVTYAIEDGIFKKSVKNAMAEYLEKEVQKTDDFDTLYNDFVLSLKPFVGIKQGTFFTKTGIEIMLVEANQNSIMVKYLWTNNKKESEGIHVFSVTKDKLKKILQAEIIPDKVKNLKTEIHSIVGHIHCELFAVYKKFYDFVIANKGEIEAVHFDARDMNFDDVNEQFLSLTREEINSKEVANHVLIIDEINRGNVSSIFGELITLLETDKRIGDKEQILLKLPYSKKEFGIPKNLYIIGTMNTADRSVEALDTALRRRFSFEEMPPNSNIVKEKAPNDFPRKEIMEKINNRIELLLDRNHTLGHAYFLKKSFESSFENEIIPLLQEYFYNDFGKIGLVLGNGFVREKSITKSNDKSIFADFETKNEVEIVKSYELIPFNEVVFGTAIQTLLA